ncbi:MAG: hypothetical protein ABFD69_16190 [Candidatus Sumerlaeia bacterium]
MSAAEKPIPIDDYPAAHSMDTIWYGVDEDGEVGAFDSGPYGEVPQLEGQKPIEPQRTESHFFRPNYYDEYDDVRDRVGEERAHSYTLDEEIFVKYYIWQNSPENPLRIEEIPEEFRNRRYLVFLKGFRFSSREPINPYDYAPCYSCDDVEYFPSQGDTTRFPLPGRAHPWSIELFNKLHVDSEQNIVYFASDDDGCLALFRTDMFGAIPAEKSGTNDIMLWDEIVRAGPDSFPVPYRLEELGAPTPIEEIYDLENDGWLCGEPVVFLMNSNEPPDGDERNTMIRTRHGSVVIFSNCLRPRWFAEAIKSGLCKGAWREWPRHWLEHPFGPASPRMWGIYHYDASWLYPTPYLRIAAPRDPLRVEQLPAAWRERMKPVRLPGVRFKDSTRVQPFESVPCVIRPFSGILNTYHFPDVWIDSRLERTHPCHEFSLKPRDEEYVLAQARKHVAFAESLARG